MPHLKHAPAFILIVMLATMGCGGCSGGDSSSRVSNVSAPNVQTEEDASRGEVPEGAEDTAIGGPIDIVPSALASSDELATHQVCAECHADDGFSDAMLDGAGRSVAPVDLWSSSMKANSARDPFFLAVMSVEKARNPELSSAIEAKCLTCHAPLASADAKWAGEQARLADLKENSTRGTMGADGVSCVSCHAMTDEGFGSESSFSGGYVLNDRNELYGPHEFPFDRPMQRRSGFTPVASDHILESEQCATCHTLFTDPIGPNGEVGGEPFPEQTPYLEWKNSAFSRGANAQSCQDCHVPTTDIEGNAIVSEIAHRPGGGSFPPVSARSPYGRHLFVGGNTLLPLIFKKYRGELGVTATDEAFDATIEATRSQLENATATIRIDNAAFRGGTVSFDVAVENLTGHKFPSAYPSRRAWLRVRVLDSDGEPVLDVGDVDGEGRILDGSGRPLASEEPGADLVPHHDTVSSIDTVQIYQSVLSDGSQTTVHLLSAAEYAKDNRLLPRGWSAEHPDAGPTLPVGTDGDADFSAGGDIVRYRLSVDGVAAAIEVELRYQVLGARWAAELFETKTGDTVRLEEMIHGVGGLRLEVIGRARVDLQ